MTAAHFAHTDARCIGVPLSATQVKLVPTDSACEIRVKDPNLARPDLCAAAFDDEGFYRTGDAVALTDPHDPNAGLVFRRRIAEDFKLATGKPARPALPRRPGQISPPALSKAHAERRLTDQIIMSITMTHARPHALTPDSHSVRVVQRPAGPPHQNCPQASGSARPPN